MIESPLAAAADSGGRRMIAAAVHIGSIGYGLPAVAVGFRRHDLRPHEPETRRSLFCAGAFAKPRSKRRCDRPLVGLTAVQGVRSVESISENLQVQLVDTDLTLNDTVATDATRRKSAAGRGPPRASRGA